MKSLVFLLILSITHRCYSSDVRGFAASSLAAGNRETSLKGQELAVKSFLLALEIPEADLTGALENDIATTKLTEEYLDDEDEVQGLITSLSGKPAQLMKTSNYYKGVVGYCPNGYTWTPWHNRDRPSGTGDWEVRSLYQPKGTCADKNPTAIHARLFVSKQPFYMGGNALTISPMTGLICQNKHQSNKRCQDYEVRFCCKPDFNDGIVGKCPKDGYWTPWHNRDHPAGTGDWEVRSLYQPKTTCTHSKIPPLAIQARLVGSQLPYQAGGDLLTISPSTGLICKNNDQKDKRCNNYEVRYCCRKSFNNDGIVGSCPKDGSWTPWHDRDDPSGTGDWEIRSHYQPKTTCTHSRIPPLAIQARLVGSQLPYQAGGDILTISQSTGLICKNNNQYDKRCADYEVRYCCRKEVEDDGIVGSCRPGFGSWTSWHNRDSPGGSGDWETRSGYRPMGKCTHGSVPPLAIQARLVGNKKSWRSTGEVMTVNPNAGLICKNRDQTDKRCENYEVRYCCRRFTFPIASSTTTLQRQRFAIEG